jgi:hypothetical protein
MPRCMYSVQQLMCFGPAFSWSVFQDYLQRSEHSPLRNESTVTISAIGTLLFSMLYFAPAIARPFFWLHPDHARLAMRVCLGVAIVALVGASFATNAGTLVAVVGFIVGLACGIMTSKSRSTRVLQLGNMQLLILFPHCSDSAIPPVAASVVRQASRFRHGSSIQRSRSRRSPLPIHLQCIARESWIGLDAADLGAMFTRWSWACLDWNSTSTSYHC